MKILKLVVVSFILSACSKIPIKDIEMKWDAGERGAFVTHLISDEEREIPKPEWDRLRIGHACLSEEDIGWALATIEKACGELKKLCDFETKEKLVKLSARVERAKKKVRGKI